MFTLKTRKINGQFAKLISGTLGINSSVAIVVATCLAERDYSGRPQRPADT